MRQRMGSNQFFSWIKPVNNHEPPSTLYPKVKNAWQGNTWNIRAEIANPGSYAIVIAGKERVIASQKYLCSTEEGCVFRRICRPRRAQSRSKYIAVDGVR
jgi:hypothetical protein